jgi:hypothetical protein
MEPLQPYSIRDFSAGHIDAINESIRPRNSVALGLNVDFDVELGSAVTRLGTFIVGGQMVAGKTVNGLHHYRQTAGASEKLLAAIDDTDGTGVIYDAATGSVEVTGLTGGRKTRMLTFLDSVLVLNGADAERAYNGTDWVTTGGTFDLANMPGGNTCGLCAEFLDKIYIAGDDSEPDRLYFSSLPAAGAINWADPDESGYIDIEPENGGGGITALTKVPGYLLVFKERSMHRWNSETTFPESLVNIGTPSQESVISHAGICAFFSASSRDSIGFYATQGGRPVPISHLKTKNIQKWVAAIPVENYANIVGWGDETHFFWSVGNLTVNGQVYKNVVFRWSVHTGEWSIRSYPQRFTVGTDYVNPSGEAFSVVGTDNGEVIEMDKPQTYSDYVTVDGEPGFVEIVFDVRTYREKFKYNQIKTVSDRIAVDTENGAGQTPYIIVDGKESVQLDSLEGDVSECRLPRDFKGNHFEFGLRGVVRGAPVVLKEIEVPYITISRNLK